MDFGVVVRKLLKTKSARSAAFVNLLVEEKYRYELSTFYYEKMYLEEFFFKSMGFLRFNQIKGDYLEFGCFGGITFGLAHKHKHLAGLELKLYGFDSFKGLPQPKGIDVHVQLKGDMAQSMNEFVEKLKDEGVEENEYVLVPGFYDQSLKTYIPSKIRLEAAALVFLDCVFYNSAVPVLDYVLPLLQTGTIIAFDDFYCFNGDPERGEQLALTEFRQKNPEIELVDFLNFGWHGKSFIVKKRIAVV